MDLIGKKPITRERLVELTGASDRFIRKEISEARRHGAVILNNQNGNGYHTSDDDKELLSYYRRESVRARKLLANLKIIRHKLIDRGITP